MGAHLSDRQWPKVKAKVMTLWLPQESSVLLVKYSLSFSQEIRAALGRPEAKGSLRAAAACWVENYAKTSIRHPQL